MISREEHNGVVVLRLSHGRANALDLVLLQDLKSAIDELSSQARALVLTGSEQMFSAGINLPTLLEEGPSYAADLIGALNDVLERFIDMPIPSVAAINGHAIAGGFVLASACDTRIMARSVGKVGLTELLVGVPFPPLALEVVRIAVGGRCARRMILHGELFSATEAAELGLVDALTDPGTLTDRAVEIADRLGSVPTSAYQYSKRQLMAPLRMRLEYLGDRHESDVRQAWTAAETQETIGKFVRERLG